MTGTRRRLSDLDDARALLLPLRGSLVIDGSVDSGRLRGGLAVLCTGLGFRDPGHGVRFVVPPEGTIARPRLLCIPAYAPDPVSAHAWLNHALDPLTAARDTDPHRPGDAGRRGRVRAPAAAPCQPGRLPATRCRL